MPRTYANHFSTLNANLADALANTFRSVLRKETPAESRDGSVKRFSMASRVSVEPFKRIPPVVSLLFD